MRDSSDPTALCCKKFMKIVNALLPWIALIVSVVSAYYAWIGIQVAQESNRIAKEAQTAAKNLFLAEKRPYMNIYIPKLPTGKYLTITDNGEISAVHTVELKNEGGIPARNIELKIYYFNDQKNLYNSLSIHVPNAQKILPEKSHFITVTISDKENTETYKAIKSGKLRFQVEVEYKSDVDELTEYQTKKQFSVGSDNVLLIGNLGEFQ